MTIATKGGQGCPPAWGCGAQRAALGAAPNVAGYPPLGTPRLDGGDTAPCAEGGPMPEEQQESAAPRARPREERAGVAHPACGDVPPGGLVRRRGRFALCSAGAGSARTRRSFEQTLRLVRSFFCALGAGCDCSLPFAQRTLSLPYRRKSASSEEGRNRANGGEWRRINRECASPAHARRNSGTRGRFVVRRLGAAGARGPGTLARWLRAEPWPPCARGPGVTGAGSGLAQRVGPQRTGPGRPEPL